jgi:DNA-binding transcriptional regulator LsrR (DeoR family)
MVGGSPASPTTKTGRHDIAEILLYIYFIKGCKKKTVTRKIQLSRRSSTGKLIRCKNLSQFKIEFHF